MAKAMDLIALIPVKNSKVVLQQNNLGFQPLRPAFDLTHLAENLTGGGEQDMKAVIANAGETAIPDICAHVQYLRSRLRAGAKLDLDDDAVRAWVGVLAIISLSELRADFNLTIEKMNLNGGRQKYMENVYRDALQQEKLLDENHCVRVLRVNGNPVALLDPEGGNIQQSLRCFCYPFSTIDNPAACMFPVNWFESGGLDQQTQKRIAHRWHDVLGNNPRTNTPFLNEAERLTFVEWLDALKDPKNSRHIGYPEAVGRVFQALDTDLNGSEGDLLDLRSTFSDPSNRPENLTAWRGALACIALAKMRGFTIEMELYQATEDPFRQVLLRGEEEWVVMKVNGVRIGVLDPELIIRPFFCIADALDHVPWFRKGKNGESGKWVEISSRTAVSMGEMDSSERRKLAYWYDDLSQKWANINQRVAAKLAESRDEIVQNWGNMPPHCSLVSFKPLTTYTTKDGSPVADRFVSILQMIQNVPDFTYSMPPVPEMFSEYLVLTMASMTNVGSRLGMVEGSGIDNSITITDESDPKHKKTEHYLALLPLRSTFTSTFIDGEDGLNLMSLKLKLDGSSIVVTMELNNDHSKVVRQWSYSKERGQILYYEDFPYLALWPYIRSDSWKEYYVAWHRSEDLECHTTSSIFREPASERLRPVSRCEEVTTFDNNPKRAWWSLTYDRFPEYVHMQFMDGSLPVEVGAIYVKPPESHITKNRMCYAAIDFGSSNTIVRLTDATGTVIDDSPNQPYRVFTNRYVKPLTMCANENPAFYGRVRDFHERFWLPFTGSGDEGAEFWEADLSKKTDQLPTVVEMYSGAGRVNNSAPQFGQFLHSNCGVMGRFLNERKDAELPSIEALGIRSNIKMRRGGDKFDGILAIQMILLECALAATEQNAGLTFAVSYPDTKMWKYLNQLWVPAAKNAQKVCSGIQSNGLVNLKFTEIMATKEFASVFVGRVTDSTGYCILDIGGGTSDISLWRSRKGGINADEAELYGGLSLKYAGNQITSESVFSFYRKNHPEHSSADADSDNTDFDMLWDLRDTNFKIYEETMKAGLGVLMNQDLYMMEYLEKLHNEVPLLVTTLVTELPFSENVRMEDEVLEPFTALMRFKVSSVFYIVARLIEFTDACDKGTHGGAYIVSMAGNGAAALDVCGERMKDDYLPWMMQQVIGTKHRIEIRNNPDHRKTEVVNGMCKLLSKKLTPQTEPQATSSGESPENASKDVEDKNLFAAMFESYCRYIEGIIGSRKMFFSVGDHFSGEDVEGPDYSSIYDMLTLQDPNRPWKCKPWEPDFWNDVTFHPENYPIYENNMDWILKEVYKEADLETTPKRTIADIAAIKMADYILLVHKYK